MAASGYTSGPLNKNEATFILESLIHNLLSEEYENIFSINNGELILTQKLRSDDVGKQHNISLLLQFSNFSHLVAFDDKECDIYMMRMKEILANKHDNAYIGFFANNIKNEEQKKLYDEKLNQAHKLAINYYTRKFNINPFLRGELFKLIELYNKNPQTFQDECFLLLVTSAFVQDFLNRQPVELITDPKNEKYKQVEMARALRIELFKDEPPIYEDLRKLKQTNSQSMTKETRGFTSYSENRLALLKPAQSLDLLATEKLPIFHTKDNLNIIIHETSIPKKRLDEYSHYPGEQEILGEQSAKETKVVNKMGNIVIVRTEQVRPLDTLIDDNYMVELALRYLYENILQKPFPDPRGSDLEVVLKDVNGKSVTVVRNNHGLAHAARQVCMVEDVLSLFMKHGKDEFKPTITEILQNHNIKQLIKIAAAFLSAGRVHELSAEEDTAGYRQSRMNSKLEFEKFIAIYYPAEVRTEELKKWIEVCSSAVYNFGKLTGLNLQQKVIFRLLHAAHIFDTPRIPKFKSGNFVGIELGKNLLNDFLFHEQYGIFPNNPVIKEELDELWSLSIKRLKETGDRTPALNPENNNYDASLFIQCSQNPAYVSQVLKITNQPPVIIQEYKIDDSVNYRIYFDTLIYILNNSVDPIQQLEIFKNEIEFNDLIYFSGKYLNTNPKDSYLENEKIKIMIENVIAIYNSHEFQKKRREVMSHPDKPISFGKSIENLPHNLRSAIPYLRDAKLDDQETIIKLQKFYNEHPSPTTLNMFVQGLNTLSSLRQLNEDTLNNKLLPLFNSPNINLNNFNQNLMKVMLRTDLQAFLTKLETQLSNNVIYEYLMPILIRLSFLLNEPSSSEILDNIIDRLALFKNTIDIRDHNNHKSINDELENIIFKKLNFQTIYNKHADLLEESLKKISDSGLYNSIIRVYLHSKISNNVMPHLVRVSESVSLLSNISMQNYNAFLNSLSKFESAINMEADKDVYTHIVYYLNEISNHVAKELIKNIRKAIIKNDMTYLHELKENNFEALKKIIQLTNNSNFPLLSYAAGANAFEAYRFLLGEGAAEFGLLGKKINSYDMVLGYIRMLQTAEIRSWLSDQNQLEAAIKNKINISNNLNILISKMEKSNIGEEKTGLTFFSSKDEMISGLINFAKKIGSILEKFPYTSENNSVEFTADEISFLLNNQSPFANDLRKLFDECLETRLIVHYSGKPLKFEGLTNETLESFTNEGFDFKYTAQFDIKYLDQNEKDKLKSFENNIIEQLRQSPEHAEVKIHINPE